MNDYIKFARKNGWVPDWAWYQLNGQSAQENWIEQREKIMVQEDAAENTPQFIFISEVKIK